MAPSPTRSTRSSVLAATAAILLIGPAASGADWPQFRGANRDGRSTETGLARAWPEAGPRLVWRRAGGDGFSGIAVAGDRLYTMLADAEHEYAVCLKVDTGDEVWRARLGPKFVEEFGDGPRSSPSVDDGLVFALTSQGRLFALKTDDGSKVWEVDLVATFGGRVPLRGVGSSPLVEGDLVLIEGGGAEGKALQAFDKRTGESRWTAETGPAGYASGIAATIGGVRQMIFLRTGTGEIVSLLPTGAVHWKHKWVPGAIATPVFVPPDRVFVSTSEDVGSILIQVETRDGVAAPKEVWASRSMKNHFSTSVLSGDHIYGFDNASLKCIRAADGVQTWVQRGFGKGTLIEADGLLIILSDQGMLALADASPEAYREHGRVQALTGKTWTLPALAGGRLYLRDHDEIVAFDLRIAGSGAPGL